MATEDLEIEKSNNPVCPHCNADPISITAQQVPFPHGPVMLVAYCADCRKVLGTSFMGMQQPQIMPGRIIRSVS